VTRIQLFALVLPLCALTACKSESIPQPAPGSASPSEPTPTLRLPGDVKPTGYQLALEIDPKQPRFNGHVTIAVQLDQARQQIWLHGRSLHVSSVTVTPIKGTAIKAAWEEMPTDGFARIALPKPVGPGPVSIELVYDAPFNERLVGIYKAPEAGIDYVFSQFEAIDARWAFPCFDEPLFKTPFEVTLTVPADDVAISNSLMVDETKIDGGKKRVRFAPTRPLPTYLVAFAVGPFDVVEHAPLPPNDVRKRPLPFRGIVPKGRGPEIKVALDAAAGLIAEEERYFGIEYPYDKLDHIAVPDFAYGAMENAGAITYREDDLLYTEGKSPFTMRHRIYNVMAHEMAHQWFGDLVTLRWWTDAWLNESFATWMAARTVDAWSPKERERVEVQRSSNQAMLTDALAASRAIRQPVNATEDIWNQFDSLTYEKGAAVLAMLEGWMGEEKFRKGVSDYLRSHAFGSGDTDELLKSYSAAAGRDVAPAFKSFIEQPGVPLVQASLTCEAGKAALKLEQSRYLPLGSTAPHGQHWQIPVCARYGTPSGIKQSCTLLAEQAGSLPLDSACGPAWVMPNAGGAGYYRWALGPAELAALTKSYAQLAPRERLSFVYNLRAGMMSGAIAAADGLRALAPAARDSDSLVAAQPIGMLEGARTSLVDESLRPKVAAYFETLYKPVQARLGWTPKRDEDTSTRELRQQVTWALANSYRDPAVRKQALAKGHALFDAGTGTLHLDAVDADLREVALGVMLQEEGAPVFDALVTQLDKISDTTLQEQITAALFLTRDPALFDRALALLPTDHIRRGAKVMAYFRSTQLFENRPHVLAWLPAHLDPLAATMPETQASMMPHAFRAADTPAQADAVKAIFEPREKKIASLKRNLDQTLESIGLNAAYVAKQRASATQFFSAPPNERGPQ
jgi:alanyl aminopeptidase